MEIREGDKVIYKFPMPINGEKKLIIGVIDYVGDNSVFIRCEDNSKLKVSFKNFENIEVIETGIEEEQF